MTLPAKLAKIPSPTPQHAKSLSPQDLHDHRQAISAEVKAVLSAYFQPSEAPETRAMQLAWWCDELQDWTLEQVVWGLRKWNRDCPDKRPTPGHIRRVLMDERGRQRAEEVRAVLTKPDPVRETVSAEVAREILAQAGIGAKRFGGAE